MDIALITGSAGLIGSEAVGFCHQKDMKIVGIDNDMRRYFFGDEASTQRRLQQIQKTYPDYTHYAIDIRSVEELDKIFSKYTTDIKLIIHTAAQPSHDWACREPLTDFSINANGTLNLLEMTRQYCQDAVFIFTSTNKVYGDSPNKLPLIEQNMRWEVDPAHPYAEKGINETMSIDDCKHSIFGASKVAADIMVQEYGRYFDMKTGIFRGGCLTGPNHAGAELHGFLSYLIMCMISGKEYTAFGYKGKQVRDNIHAYDLVNMFWEFYENPKSGEAYNAGGSRYSNCSILEAIEIGESFTGKKLKWKYAETNRVGDHIWWISDVSKFKCHYPNWDYKYNLNDIITQIVESLVK